MMMMGDWDDGEVEGEDEGGGEGDVGDGIAAG